MVMKTYVGKILVATIGIGLLILPLPDTFATQAARDILREHGITGPAADAILSYFEQLEELGLPTELLRLRLREGIAKRVDPRQIEAALERRTRLLKQSHDLLSARSRVDSARRHRGRVSAETGVETLTRALESGVPIALFEELYQSQRGIHARRLRPIVEAGEMMHLAGIETESVRQFMLDCRDRNLARMETLRAARYWIDKHRREIDPETIRRQLWGKLESRENGRSDRRMQRPQEHREHVPRQRRPTDRQRRESQRVN